MTESRILRSPAPLSDPARFSCILDGIASAVLVSDAEGRFVLVNPSAAALTGHLSEELRGRDYRCLFPSDHHARLSAMLHEVLTTNRRSTTEDIRVQHKSGSARVAAVTLAPLHDNEADGIVWTLEDVTERKRSEEALRRSEASLAKAQQIAHLGSWDWDIVHNTLSWSPEIYRIFGLGVGEFGGTFESFLLRVHPHDRADVRARVAAALRRERSYRLNHRIVLRDGSERIVHEEADVTFDAVGTPLRMIGTAQDITDLKRAEERLRQSKALFTTAFRASPDPIAIIRMSDSRIASANESFLAASGYAHKEVLGKTSQQLGWMDASQCERLWRELRERGRVRDMDVQTRTRAGETRDLLLSAEPIDINEELYALVAAHDVTERKQALSRARFQADLLDMVEQAVVAIDLQGAITFWNRAAEKLYGWSAAEVQGRNMQELDPAPISKIAHMLPRLFKGESWASEADARRRDRSTFRASLSASPVRDESGAVVGVIGVCSDITERKKWEEEVIKAQKLESIGLLAGGIAHDFNNVLTAIVGNVALAKLYAKEGEPLFEALTGAEQGFWRAQDLTRQLLTFAKGGAPMRTVTAIAPLLQDTPRFALAGSNVRVECDIPPDLWLANVDAGQISQVLNNLVVNAKQAMPAGGAVTIAAQNIRLHADQAPPLPAGDYIKISVADHGVGIPPDNLAKIFDPYFTTKAGGTGLGLATSYSIIKRHEGHIDVQSREGCGSTFHVYLPAVKERRAQGARPVETIARGRGRVLLMDDEPAIRQVGSTLLARLGYEVACAAEGVEALRLYEGALKSAPFDAVILDLTVPDGMGGRECCDYLKRLDPDVRVIVSSGYSNDPVMADFARHGFAGRIAKPYQLAELSETLLRVAGARATAKAE